MRVIRAGGENFLLGGCNRVTAEIACGLRCGLARRGKGMERAHIFVR